MFLSRACLLVGAALLALSLADEGTMPPLSVEGFSNFLRSNRLEYPRRELPARLSLYRRVAAQVRAHNSLSDREYDLTVNQFSAMTDSERSQYLGAASNETEEDASRILPRAEPQLLKRELRLPARVDHHLYGTVNPAKDQGKGSSCKSSWAFAATAVLETVFAQTTWKLRRFSDKEILDCTYEQMSSHRDGCEGGSYDVVYNYLQMHSHISPEKEITYEPKDGPCNYADKENWLGLVRVEGWNWPRGDSELMQALYHTAVGITIKIENLFHSYKSGIYGGCAQPHFEVDQGHSMEAVGYDAKSWKLKNSWGPAWGEGGFVRISRGRANNCGISTYAKYPILDYDISDVVYLVNSETGRYLSMPAGPSEDIRTGISENSYGTMGLIGTDSDYNGDARWIIKTISEGLYFIKHWHSGRYVLDPSKEVTVAEGTSRNARQVLGTDRNYSGRAKYRKISYSSGNSAFVNVYTKRYIFAAGGSVKTLTGPVGQYGGEKIVATDKNYDGRASWMIVPLTEEHKKRLSPSGAHIF